MFIQFHNKSIKSSTKKDAQVICRLVEEDDSSKRTKLFKKEGRYYLNLKCCEDGDISIESFENSINEINNFPKIKSIGFDGDILDSDLLSIIVENLENVQVNIFLGNKISKKEIEKQKGENLVSRKQDSLEIPEKEKIISKIPKKNFSYKNFKEFTLDFSEKCGDGWKNFFKLLNDEDVLKKLSNFLKKETEILEGEGKGEEILPPVESVYKAFELCDLENLKVCIIGQDPYHTPGAAMGLAFGHNFDKVGGIQPSLKNIFKELEDDGFNPNKSGDLSKWAEQGVLLINTSLTVRQHQPESHTAKAKKSVWREFSDMLFRYINRKCPHLVVIMWGAHAKSFSDCFSKDKHKILESAHPSPFSCSGFFGTKPFSKTNKQLKSWGYDEIDWNLE